MNRNLLGFGLMLVVLGFGFGAYILSFLGLILLIPSIIPDPPPPAKHAPQKEKQEPRRIIPRQPSQPADAPQPQRSYMQDISPPPQPQAYASALFPAPMFPSLSPMAAPMQPPEEAARGKQESRDELVEVGAILALLKLALG